MNTWRHLNYLTADPALWVQFMNLSTIEWGIGHFPPELIATAGRAEDLTDLAENALVVEQAGKTHLGSSPIEYSTFGIISGFFIVWLLCWIFYNCQTDGFRSDGGPANSDFMSAVEFRETLDTKYYESVITDVELFDPDDKRHLADEKASDNKLTAAEVEATTALMRKMYGLDLDVWSHEGSPETQPHEIEYLQKQSDAAWAEIRSKIDLWSARRGSMTKEEKGHFDSLVAIVNQIPKARYGVRNIEQ